MLGRQPVACVGVAAAGPFASPFQLGIPLPGEDTTCALADTLAGSTQGPEWALNQEEA